MTRTLFFFTALAAMLAAMTAILIRVELAYSDVGPLFQTSDGAPDGEKFDRVVIFHSSISYLAVILLGTTMASAARSKNAPLSRLFVGVGWILSLVTLALIVASMLPSPTIDPTGTGWALYLPQSDQQQNLLRTLLIPLLPAVSVDPATLNLSHIFKLPAAAMLFLGLYAMLSTLPSFRWLPALGVLLLFPITLLVGRLIFEEDITFLVNLYFLAAFPLLACASIRLIDAAPSWLMILTVGIIASMIGQIILINVTLQFSAVGPTLAPASLYTFPLGIAFFALPALILFDREIDLPAWGTTLALCGILLPLAQWITYLAILGIRNMPASYMTFPDTSARDNLLTSGNVMLFLFLYVTTITAIRRAAR